ALMQVFSGGGKQACGNFAAVGQALRDGKLVDDLKRCVVQAVIAERHNLSTNIVEKPRPPQMPLLQQPQCRQNVLLLGELVFATASRRQGKRISERQLERLRTDFAV